MEGAETMTTCNRNLAIQKILEMPKERVSKVLIFMAGMDAEQMLREEREDDSSAGIKQSERR